MNWVAVSDRTSVLVSPVVDELVFYREPPSSASMFECLRLAWEDAQREARAAYEDWHLRGGPDAYPVYRTAQDRADAAQDAVAESGARRS